MGIRPPGRRPGVVPTACPGDGRSRDEGPYRPLCERVHARPRRRRTGRRGLLPVGPAAAGDAPTLTRGERRATRMLDRWLQWMRHRLSDEIESQEDPELLLQRAQEEMRALHKRNR